MVSNDPSGRYRIRIGLGLNLYQRGCALDQRREQISVVVRDHALHHGRHALQAGAGVDGRLGQRAHLAVGLAVELHEDQIPDFDVAAALAGEGAIGVAGVARRRAHVVIDLAARTAGAGVAHLPEVILHAHLEDAAGGDARVEPVLVGLVVARDALLALEDGDVELVLRKAEPVGRGDQLPGVSDRLLLEVVAEAEIAQHLEKGVVAISEAHVLQIVVLAAGAYALLR